MKKDKSDIIQSYLNKLEKKHGRLTPSIVVEAAKPEKSPIHSYFQWNDIKAADSYRLWQARQLIAKVYVNIDSDNNSNKTESVKVRLYHSIDTGDLEDAEEDRQYVNIYRIISDEHMREKLLEDAKRDMAFFITKYNILNELQPIIAEMQKIIKED